VIRAFLQFCEGFALGVPIAVALVYLAEALREWRRR
jgi:hypothetical protein